VKGLDLAERFFDEYGLPALKEHYPNWVDRVSAGLIGRGSEVLEADDAWSRDHGWGPRFCLLVDEEDLRTTGAEMEARLNELRLSTFRGVDLDAQRAAPIAVSTVDRCCRGLTGAPWPPSTMRAWAFADENGLRFAQAGRVFHHPSGELAARKRAFEGAYYPDAVWRWRIASCLYRLWHYGDYNTCNRLLRRRDGVAALVGQGIFVEAAMQLAFLLNRQFAPYWKWLHWGLRRLPSLSDALEPLLVELEAASGLEARADVIREICEWYLGVLCGRGTFPDRGWRNFMGAFEIVGSIEDPEVKALVEEYFDRYKHL
jgi:hypothetical protein